MRIDHSCSKTSFKKQKFSTCDAVRRPNHHSARINDNVRNDSSQTVCKEPSRLKAKDKIDFPDESKATNESKFQKSATKLATYLLLGS